MSKVHIGEKIKEVWKDSRLKGTEFAKLINKDRQVIYDIFKRETIDTGLLEKISEVLQYDFFYSYSENNLTLVKEGKDTYGFASKDELKNLTLVVQTLAREVEKLREALPQKKAPVKRSTGKKARNSRS